ncbi:hypothetical protein DFA_08874 [Cavenderia fasciculata]|uniref:Single domain-containing protein n=1 Tax=Cavenderia fasciculata TaxID=261658 RepID=F4Q4S7_CACFS|nr:uncharacterized protein DFA_08874 [Cavenderia fasciculata]EGG17873.1 hypothetical protein DFA_08874 [Cavenderia fasciculata]|eukprot:XP_004356357.1 hypothetical protein DFA_08874 [Cavenderia fasciculata]
MSINHSYNDVLSDISQDEYCYKDTVDENGKRIPVRCTQYNSLPPGCSLNPGVSGAEYPECCPSVYCPE